MVSRKENVFRRPRPLPTLRKRKVTDLLAPISIRRDQSFRVIVKVREGDSYKYLAHSKTSDKCCFLFPSNNWIFALKIWVELGVRVHSILDRKPELSNPDSYPFLKGDSSKNNTRQMEGKIVLCY